MTFITALICLFGIVDRVEAGVATIEWSDGTFTELRLPLVKELPQEGSSIQVEIILPVNSKAGVPRHHSMSVVAPKNPGEVDGWTEMERPSTINL